MSEKEKPLDRARREIRHIETSYTRKDIIENWISDRTTAYSLQNQIARLRSELEEKEKELAEARAEVERLKGQKKAVDMFYGGDVFQCPKCLAIYPASNVHHCQTGLKGEGE